MGLFVIGAGTAEHFGLPGVRALFVLIIAAMMIEMITTFIKNIKSKNNYALFAIWFLWLSLMGVAAYNISDRPWIVLLMLLIISGADVGAWFFGRLIGGDKMWEKLSPNKSWSGQIFGIICGTSAAILYGLLGTDTFMPELMWIGIGVALLSQYGDLTASWLKRKLNIKDFSNIIPGHGGITDRFDGWIYVLPIIWLIVL